jgi:hypothetical protein
MARSLYAQSLSVGLIPESGKPQITPSKEPVQQLLSPPLAACPPQEERRQRGGEKGLVKPIRVFYQGWKVFSS